MGAVSNGLVFLLVESSRSMRAGVWASGLKLWPGRGLRALNGSIQEGPYIYMYIYIKNSGIKPPKP